MADDKLTDDELDTLFAAARGRQPQPSPHFPGRVAVDAQSVLDARRAPHAPSLWEQIVTALGGPSGLGGLVAAGAVGLWLGIAPPALIGDPAGAALGETPLVDLVSDDALDFAALLDEG